MDLSVIAEGVGAGDQLDQLNQIGRRPSPRLPLHPRADPPARLAARPNTPKPKPSELGAVAACSQLCSQAGRQKATTSVGRRQREGQRRLEATLGDTRRRPARIA